jgi:hypothetical protein
LDSQNAVGIQLSTVGFSFVEQVQSLGLPGSKNLQLNVFFGRGIGRRRERHRTHGQEQKSSGKKGFVHGDEKHFHAGELVAILKG